MFRLMATQEILQHLLSHTLKAMLMSAYGSFKRRSNSSIKGWQTGISLSKK
jgi:hypothetical protein